MIRIDEIYYNVFASSMQHRPEVALHWFDPFGSVRFGDLRKTPAEMSRIDLRLVFWDQEPVYEHTARTFFDRYNIVHRDSPTIVITSERQSQDLDLICDLYKLNSDYYFFHGWAALDWYRGYNHSYLFQPWGSRTFQYPFICANNVVGGGRIHRIKLFAELVRRDLLEKNLISFPRICPYDRVSVQDLARKANIDLPECDLPRIIDHVKNHSNDSHRIDFWEQGTRSFAHVVTETVFDSKRLHLTEKTFKPIVMQQPFILVAPAGSLAYLQDYGFRTFDELWDESYDELDDQHRIDAVADILSDVSSWTPYEMQRAQRRVDDIVQHNFQWFYGGFQDLLWTELTNMIQRW